MDASPSVELSSTQNPKIKQLIKLRQKRSRDQMGLYLIEGYRELLRAHEGGHTVESLYICPELFLGSNEEKLIELYRLSGAEVYLCSKKVFEHISYRDRPDGLLGLSKKQSLSLKDFEPKSKTPLFVLAVGIEKPGNLGTILRSADAVGADAVFVVDHVTDIYNPNVVRASVGALFTQPVLQVKSEEIFNWLEERGVQTVASSPDAQIKYTDLDYRAASALLVGCEQYGLDDFWLEKASSSVSIPMMGKADSLNAATSTTVLLYEVLRQRQQS